MGEITVIRDLDDFGPLLDAAGPDGFANWNRHPLYGDFGRALHGAINAERRSHAVHHFAVVDGDGALIVAPATCDGESVSAYGNPLALGFRRGLGRKRRKRAFAAAFGELRRIAAEHGAADIRILGGDGGAPMTEIDLACIGQGARPEAHLHAAIDCRAGEQEVHRGLRDSYRSLVNWGRRQLRCVYVNADNPDRAEFDRYPGFHAKVAGGARYGDRYWQVFWDEIAAGRGELSLGFLEDGTLAAGTVVIDAGATAYYTSGVYERELFDKPLGHFPVFDSVLRAGARGMARYDLGEIFAAGAAPEKDVQIGFFKKGFTSDFVLRTVWLLGLDEPY